MKTFWATMVAALLFMLTMGAASAREAREQQRIDYLLKTVESSKGIVFIRNGSEYGGAAAVKHLRDKLNYAGDRIKTAEQFIQYCATESSITHRKYMVRLPDGTTEEAGKYFGGLLRSWNPPGG